MTKQRPDPPATCNCDTCALRLSGALAPYNDASTEQIDRLQAAATRAASRMRLRGYDTCMEGAAFHAGLMPVKGTPAAPACAEGTWALLDDIGRFSGSIQVLDERRCGSG